jgi:hypothetical protein
MGAPPRNLLRDCSSYTSQKWTQPPRFSLSLALAEPLPQPKRLIPAAVARMGISRPDRSVCRAKVRRMRFRNRRMVHVHSGGHPRIRNAFATEVRVKGLRSGAAPGQRRAKGSAHGVGRHPSLPSAQLVRSISSGSK